VYQRGVTHEPFATREGDSRGKGIMKTRLFQRVMTSGLVWLVSLAALRAVAMEPTGLPLPDTGWYASAEALFLQLDPGSLETGQRKSSTSDSRTGMPAGW
jgi:hypothetical protein